MFNGFPLAIASNDDAFANALIISNWVMMDVPTWGGDMHEHCTGM